MAQYKYAFQKFDKENMARSVGRDVAVSVKQSIEICKFIKHKNVQRAKAILKNAIEKKEPIPFTRFTNGLGHKAGMCAGRYPVKASQNILRLIESAEINAQQKGLNTANLVICHACSHRAAKSWHYGRHRRRLMKRTHIEIVLEERSQKKMENASEKAGKEEKKEAPKSQSKTSVKIEEPSAEKPKKPVTEAKQSKPKENKKEVKND